MYLDRQDPYGIALREFVHGNTAGVLEKRYANGVSEPVPVEAFFREPDYFGSDSWALRHCRGRVLDVGAGCGQHAHYLERAGYEVTAIDVVPEAVHIMRELGLSDVREISFYDMPAEGYDTLLFLGRTIGFAETLKGLDGILGKCRELLNSGGQVLLTSLDVERSAVLTEDENVGTVKSYPGEVRFRFVYGGIVGAELRWLYIDPQTLSERAHLCGWESEVLYDEGDGNYLGRLTPVA
jgi:SAM-dependent methyltransferase